MVLTQSLTIDLVKMFETGTSVMICRQHAHSGQGIHDAGRTVLSAGLELRMALYARTQLCAGLLETILIDRLDGLASAHGDGFDPL